MPTAAELVCVDPNRVGEIWPHVGPLLKGACRRTRLNAFEDIEADITPLQRLGVPTFGLLQDSRTYFNYHHTAADTLDKVDPRQLQENAAAMAMLAYTIANLPEPLPRIERQQ